MGNDAARVAAVVVFPPIFLIPVVHIAEIGIVRIGGVDVFNFSIFPLVNAGPAVFVVCPLLAVGNDGDVEKAANGLINVSVRSNCAGNVNFVDNGDLGQRQRFWVRALRLDAFGREEQKQKGAQEDSVSDADAEGGGGCLRFQDFPNFLEQGLFLQCCGFHGVDMSVVCVWWIGRFGEVRRCVCCGHCVTRFPIRVRLLRHKVAFDKHCTVSVLFVRLAA